MKTMFMRCGVVLSLLPALALFVGCSGKHDNNEDKGHKDHTHAKKTTEKEGHSSPDKWWCNPHGIPEDECSMCSPEIEKACKAKGDWCDKHDRARSQCFICEPALKEKFAARYRDRYRKDPPRPTDNERKDDTKSEK